MNSFPVIEKINGFIVLDDAKDKVYEIRVNYKQLDIEIYSKPVDFCDIGLIIVGRNFFKNTENETLLKKKLNSIFGEV